MWRRRWHCMHLPVSDPDGIIRILELRSVCVSALKSTLQKGRRSGACTSVLAAALQLAEAEQGYVCEVQRHCCKHAAA